MQTERKSVTPSEPCLTFGSIVVLFHSILLLVSNWSTLLNDLMTIIFFLSLMKAWWWAIEWGRQDTREILSFLSRSVGRVACLNVCSSRTVLQPLFLTTCVCCSFRSRCSRTMVFLSLTFCLVFFLPVWVFESWQSNCRHVWYFSFPRRQNTHKENRGRKGKRRKKMRTSGEGERS